MKKMPFRFARRVRNLEIKTYCPTKKKPGRESGRQQQLCPNCVLPIVVTFIFAFTVIQVQSQLLIVIHRTIVAYKSRSLAFEEVYGPSHNDSKSQGDLLAFSKKFDSAWPNSSRVVEWKPPDQSYPYHVPRVPHPPPIDHIWKVACSEVPKLLHGNISINTKENVSLEQLGKSNPQVLPGGRWTPEGCKPRFHVALIIPYRFRWNHLKLLLTVLHPMLRRQEMSYQVFVAEQFGNYTFNKGVLMNAAFLIALNSSNAFDCVIFHDVDLLPETDSNIYGCANSPSHLSVSIDAYGYRLPYSKLVGGVFAISVKHFIQVNGYSNLYWGWGAEDDDMYKRLIANQLPINRPRPDLAKYKMLQHGRRAPNQFINPLIRTARVRFPQDGLTTCHFRLVVSSAQPLFTHFLVDVGQPSYAVLEPNLHLESMIPPPPPSPTSHHHHQRLEDEDSLSVRQVVQPSSGSKSKRELFLLSGIQRDDPDSDNQWDDSPSPDGNKNAHHRQQEEHFDHARARHGKPAIPGPLGSVPSNNGGRGSRPARSLGHHHLSSSTNSPADRSDARPLVGDSRRLWGSSKLGKSPFDDIPLDPDIPVSDEDEEDSDDEDD